MLLARAKSDIGKIRERNEDSFICEPPLFVVADGMGGHVAGEIASQLATDAVQKDFARLAGDLRPDHLFEQAIFEANNLIYQMAQDKSECAGMGTTLTAAYLDGSTLYWGHVGDSRLYLAHNGELSQLTEDHSLVGELVRNGSISPEDAVVHPHRNILTRAVGTSEQIKVDSGCTPLADGDTFLLCTDGLTNMLSDADILTIIQNDDVQEAVNILIETANAAGGLDNVTAVLVRYGRP